MTPQSNAERKGTNPRYERPSTTQYFSAQPSTADVRKNLGLTLRGHEVTVESSHGVFSAASLDKGTAVLLKLAPQAPPTGTFLDLGSGWGPLSLALALESPKATVWAVDVNERALELTGRNAAVNGATNVTTVTPENLPTDVTFDLIWSNPPIRIGKTALHELLMTYLTRLNSNGTAYLVVQKHLGADSLIPWLAQELGDSYTVSRFDSSKGYRIIEVVRIP